MTLPITQSVLPYHSTAYSTRNIYVNISRYNIKTRAMQCKRNSSSFIKLVLIPAQQVAALTANIRRQSGQAGSRSEPEQYSKEIQSCDIYKWFSTWCNQKYSFIASCGFQGLQPQPIKSLCYRCGRKVLIWINLLHYLPCRFSSDTHYIKSNQVKYLIWEDDTQRWSYSFFFQPHLVPYDWEQ